MKYILILLVITKIMYAQNSQLNLNEHIINRKGKLFLKIENEYRITPYYKNYVSFEEFRGFLNKDLALSGYALNYSLNYFITKKISLNFSQSLRYDTVLFKIDYPEVISSNVGEKIFFSDYHFSIDFYFIKIKNTEVFARIGKSLLNYGTEYSISEKISSNMTSTIQYSTAFYPSNFAIGFKRNKLDFLLGAYYSSETPYEPIISHTTIPYINIGYTLFKL